MSVIAYRFKGQAIDQGVLERFILSNTIMGMASVQSEAGKAPYIATIRIELSKIKDQLAGVTKLLDRWKDRDVLMYYVNAEAGVKPAQPFDLLFNTDNKASCVAFCLNLKDNDQVTKFLMPAVQKMLPKDGDLDQLLEDMKDDSFGESLNKMYEDNEGVSVFLYANGQSLIIGPEGVTGEDRDWGWATHYYEEEDGAATGTADGDGTDESDAALADLLGTDAPEPPVQDQPKPDAAKSKFKVPNKPTVETKKLDVTGTKLEIEHEKFVPKPGMREREFDKLVLKYMDLVPKNAFAEYQKGKFFLMVPKTAMASAMTSAAAQQHKPDPKAVQQQPAPQEHKGLKRLDELPIMSDETRAEVTSILKDPKHAEFMDKDKAKIIDPTAYKDYDKKLASFTEQLGIDNIDMTINWPHSLRVKIGESKNGVEALACMCTWLSYELGMARQKQEGQATDEGEAGAIPEVKEEVAEQPRKRSGFRPPQGMRKAG